MTKKKGPGRPKLPKSAKKVGLSLKMHPDVFNALVERAKVYKRKLSAQAEFELTNFGLLESIKEPVGK